MMSRKAGRFLEMMMCAALAVGLAGRPVHGQGRVSRSSADDENPVGWAAAEGGITGGQGGSVVTVSDEESFLKAVQSKEPLTIRVSGTIRLSKPARVRSDKTILGLGDDAALRGGGLSIRRVSNVIVRNLAISDANDAIDIDAARHVWVDHCDLSACHDGLVDIKHGSDLITVSWNHFHDHHKTALLGHSDKPQARREDTGRLRTTYHHNFFDGTEARHPRVRFADPVHVFNNYFFHNDHGVHSAMDAGVLVEANYFEGVRHPTETKFGASPDEGNLVNRDNIFVGCRYQPQVRGTVKEIGDAYDYTPDRAADVPAIVKRGAGVGKIKT